ncbi:hypothetical protein CK203_022918 [Vitis vinifera]|uniref:Uncharacterized protein n=1 Tax=Vitis vinifera TaxID=29760 RepID=A0A438IWY8_VITVI|nr:hypothetical protein CK203_022918 [Vitis vinifera]
MKNQALELHIPLPKSVTETGVEVLTARLPSSPSMFPWLKS